MVTPKQPLATRHGTRIAFHNTNSDRQLKLNTHFLIEKIKFRDNFISSSAQWINVYIYEMSLFFEICDLSAWSSDRRSIVPDKIH